MKKLGHAIALLGCLFAGPVLAAIPQMPRSIAPSEPDLDRAQRGAFFLAGCLADMASGRVALAEDECTKAIALDPKSPVAYKLRGYGRLIARHYELAEADFHAALRLGPDDAENRAGLGQSYNGMHVYEKAVVQFARAVKLDPANAAYHTGLCWTRAGTGRHLDLAMASCNRGLRLAPGTAGSLSTRAMLWLRMHRYRNAMADYNASLTVRDAQPSAKFGRGLARLALGEKFQGATDILEARRGDGDIDMLYVHMGVLQRSCAERGKHCPAGFPAPAKTPANTGSWLTVSLHGDPDEDYALAIEAHRLDIMVSQLALMLGRNGRILLELPQGHQAILLRVSQAVATFNRLLPRACATGRLRKQDCRAFQPKWTADVDPAKAVEQAYGRIEPVWVSLCQGHRCPIE